MGDRPCPRPTRVRGESGQRPTAAQGCRGRGSTGRGSECTSPLPKDKIPNSDKLPRFQSPGSLWAFPGGGSSQGAAEASGRLSWGAQPKHPEEGWPGSRALASQAGSEGRARSGWGAPVSHCGLGSFCLYPLCRPPGEPGPVPGWPSTVDGHVGRGPGPTLRPGRGAAPPAPLPRGSCDWHFSASLTESPPSARMGVFTAPSPQQLPCRPPTVRKTNQGRSSGSKAQVGVLGSP